MPGVVAYLDHNDVPGENNAAVPPLQIEPEELFCSGKVKYAGQPVGLIVADTSDKARTAAAKVSITYKNHKTPVIGLREGLKIPERVEKKIDRQMGDSIKGTFCIVII